MAAPPGPNATGALLPGEAGQPPPRDLVVAPWGDRDALQSRRKHTVDPKSNTQQM